MALSDRELEDSSKTFAQEGYVVLRGVVPAEPLARLSNTLSAEFARAKQAGELFSGGGTISGHLNCFPGAQSRFVFDSLNEARVFELVRRISPEARRLPNIGGNLNLPRSSAQNHHIDGYASRSFLIVNVAAVDTTAKNGATEVSPRSHLRDYRYWQFALAGHRTVRVETKAGDVVIRPSTLWHRGMPNHTATIRPMLAFSWEDGGSELVDPYSRFGGKITFLSNRYAQDVSGQLRERAFAAMPAVGAGYLFVRSLLDN